MTRIAGQPAITGTPLTGRLALLSSVCRALGVTTPALDFFALPAPTHLLTGGVDAARDDILDLIEPDAASLARAASAQLPA
jgi:hypothetical protein